MQSGDSFPVSDPFIERASFTDMFCYYPVCLDKFTRLAFLRLYVIIKTEANTGFIQTGKMQ